MKNIFKSVLVGALSTVALTGCIDEVVPTNGVDQDQIDSNEKAAVSKIWAMPGYMVQFNSLGRTDEWHGDCGYASLMHIRDFMTGDMCLTGPMLTYDQYYYFSIAGIGPNSAYTQFLWQYYYKLIQTANIAAAQFTADSEEEIHQGYHAVALAYRALGYLELGQWFDFLPNDKTSNINVNGKDVLNLTVPIVTEKTTEDEARKNPRVSKDDLVAFILEDLDYAEQNIDKSDLRSKILPDLSCVYGLKARLYLWTENYAKAEEYANLAIAESGCDYLTESEWVSPTTGFNTLDNNSWMWGLVSKAEDDNVQTGICNWTSFMSLEADYGYAGAGCAPAVDASMYERIPDTDFRKLSWLPESMSNPLLYDISLNEPDYLYYFCYYFPYGTIKFRPGFGNVADYTVGSATAVPVMRVEEMKFIAMEAAAHQSAAQGKQDLVEFMTTYRDPDYSCDVTSTDDVVEEIVFQKRVELWGEGLALWDIKRLNYSVTRSYVGSNWEEDKAFNTDGRPAWMNMIMVIYEENNNEGVRDWNNPNFAQVYTAIPIPDDDDVEPEEVMSRAGGYGPIQPLRTPNPRLKKYRPMWINE